MTELTRRTLIGATGLTTLAAVVGCVGDQPGPGPTPGGAPDIVPSSTPSNGSPLLLAFFSRAGENYWEGGRRTLEVGNTKVIAQMIAERIECDIYEIRAADPYPSAYAQTVDRNVKEQDEDARPEIAGDLLELSRYGTVLLGSPVWNTRAPMIMRTFLEQAGRLAGKTIHPFCTYALGPGSVFDDYARSCPDAILRKGLGIRGEDTLRATDQVETWLQASELI